MFPLRKAGLVFNNRFGLEGGNPIRNSQQVLGHSPAFSLRTDFRTVRRFRDAIELE